MKYSRKQITYLAMPLLWKVILLIFICVIFFAFAGATQNEENDEFDDESQFEEQWKELISIFNIIDQYASKDIKNKDIFYGGIRGMLSTLDPHTHFLDSDAFSYMREEQEGSFFGIGISFDISPEGYLRVVAPIEGTPAAKLGIRAGDRIVKINGETTKNITEIEVIRKLRGEKGSKVVVTIEREGQTELKDYTIVRDKIPLFTVREPYILRSDIGYIKITQFSKPTKEELLKGLEKLEQQGMKKLLLDLRFNPGGLLDQAVEVADIFIDKGDKIVVTDGRIPSSHFEFRATTQEKYKHLPIIILVNHASASASEIVAGALQDLDRALIVGTTTYGKGLVQRQYPLEPHTLGTALQITTAKYYTPSKRCIQKSYHTLHEMYANRNIGEQGIIPEDEQVYYSRGGRKLAGGGGIVPDVQIEQKIPDIIASLLFKDCFFNFAVTFSSKQDTLDNNFVVTDELLQEFKDYAFTQLDQKIDEEKWQEEKPILKLWLKQEIISAYFGLDEKLKVANEHDQQLLDALELFDEAEALIEKYHEKDH